ncbi:MAG: hypothetical protein P9X22_03680 [Candidatus Zapsychrus exili]|nr:hypothetical protein [Candidatus Zapsychrus exili]
MPFYFGWGVLKESLKISLPLTPRIFLGVIGTHFNKYIVSILNTMGGVGVLSIAQKISNMTFMFMTALQNVFSPHVYKLMFSSKLSADKEIGKYLTSFVYISTFVCLLLSLFSKEALWILTGPSFYEAAPLISILSVYYGFQFFGKINGIQLIYKKKTAITSLLTVVNIIVGVVISIPLVMNFGVIGSVWATFLVSLIVGGTAFIIAQRYFYVHWETKKIMAIFGMLCFSGLLALFTMSDLVIYSVALILKLLCVGVYLFLGAKFCIVTRGNIKLLWDIVTFKKNKIVVNATL